MADKTTKEVPVFFPNKKNYIFLQKLPETYTDNNIISNIFINLIKIYYNNSIYGNTTKSLVNTMATLNPILFLNKYFNLYKFINSNFPYGYAIKLDIEYINSKSMDYKKKDKYNDAVELIYNEQLDKGITKYKPLSLHFFHYIEILNNFKKSLNLQKSKKCLEITTTPSFFEALEYLTLKHNYNINEINVFSQFRVNTDDSMKYLEYLSRLTTFTKLNLTSNIIDINHNEDNYDLMLLNIFDYNLTPTEFHYRSKFMPYQLMYIDKYLKVGGSCIFVTPSILSTYYASIVQVLKSWFDNIEINTPEIYGHYKHFPLRFIICSNRKKVLKNKTKIKSFITKMEKKNLFEDRYYKVEEYFDLHKPMFAMKKDEDLYDMIKQKNQEYDERSIKVFKDRIKLYKKINDGRLSKKQVEILDRKTKIRQFIHSVNWARKYDFEIYEPYLKVIDGLISGKILGDYYQMYHDGIVLSIDDFDSSKAKYNAEDMEDRVRAGKYRISNIHRLIDTRPKASWEEMESKIRYYRNSRQEYRLSIHLREEYGLSRMSQAWCKMFEILNYIPEITDIKMNKKTEYRTFHLCEAPGNFISALYYYLLWNEPKLLKRWTWIAQTLITPGSDKLGDIFGYMRKYRRNWDYGVARNGDVLDKENQRYYLKKYGRRVENGRVVGGIDFVTSDCGNKDMGSIETAQAINIDIEDSILKRLHDAEMKMLLGLTKIGGCCVFKAYLPIGSVNELKELHKFEREFEEVNYIKVRLNIYSPEMYIVGINKLLNPREINLSQFLDKVLSVQNVLLDAHELEIKRRLFYHDHDNKITKEQWDNVDKWLKKKNVEWAKDVGIKNMKNRRNELF